jgi:hypothetical protein
MGAAGLVEKPGDKHLIVVEAAAADRAHPLTPASQAVGAAVYVHKPVRLAHGGEGGGFYPFPVNKPDGTDRAGPGHPGFALQVLGCAPFATAETMAFGSEAEKEAVSKVEQARADNGKTQNLKI